MEKYIYTIKNKNKSMICFNIIYKMNNKEVHHER